MTKLHLNRDDPLCSLIELQVKIDSIYYILKYPPILQKEQNNKSKWACLWYLYCH